MSEYYYYALAQSIISYGVYICESVHKSHLHSFNITINNLFKIILGKFRLYLVW